MRYQAALLPDYGVRRKDGPGFGIADGETRQPCQYVAYRWARQDSNPRPSRYERPALTAELQAPTVHHQRDAERALYITVCTLTSVRLR